MFNQIYIHFINTLFVLESFIISCWLLKGRKIGIGIGIGQFARKKSVSESESASLLEKKSVSESASLLEKNRYRNRPRKIMIGASLVFHDRTNPEWMLREILLPVIGSLFWMNYSFNWSFSRDVTPLYERPPGGQNEALLASYFYTDCIK